jgi:hypothetical protein
VKLDAIRQRLAVLTLKALGWVIDKLEEQANK